MARFGIAFSVALGIAAALATTVANWDWRWTYAVSAVLALMALLLLAPIELPGAAPIERREWRRAAGLLGAPVLVGGIAAIAQFGLVVFIPIFAVDSWALGATAAAGVLLVGRIASIPGKWIAGWMIDRLGAEAASRLVGLSVIGSGLLWVLLPSTWPAVAMSVFFAAAVGAMFPMANVVAVSRFGELGSLLGVFRFSQMAVAGVSVSVVGAIASLIGLRPTLALGMLALSPILLLRPAESQQTV